MPNRYAATGQSVGAASPGRTCLAVEAAATKRGEIYEMLLSARGTPADNALQITFRRFTVAGTRTAVTPQALDPGDPAAILAAGENHTVEPTYTAGSELLDIGLNQRATLQWKASLGGELVTPATAANGIGITFIHASYTGSTEASAHWRE